MDFLGCVLILLLDFAASALGFWVITLLLPMLGIEIVWSWGGAFVCWLILKVIKLVV